MSCEEKTLIQYKKVFEECDSDQNNLIYFKELKAFLRSSGHTRDLPVDKIRYVFKLADKDGNRAINFEEFVDTLEHPDLQHVFGNYVNSYIKFLIPQQKPKPVPVVQRIVPKGRSVRFRSQKQYEFTATPGSELQEYSKILIKDDDEEIAYADSFTCCPPPFAMVLITLLELVFFLTDELTEENSTLTGRGVTAQVFIYAPNKRHQAWRFLTYMFVHIGYLHIVVNLAFQLLLGIPLEMVHKWWRVSLLYFSGVIAGSLATSITDPYVRLAGASGGVYCLMTAHLATIVMNWREMTFPFIQLLIFGIIIFCDLGSSIYDRYYLNTNDQIGYAAHLGGAVAGLLVGIYILKNLNVRNCEKYVWWAAMITYVLLMLSAIFMNIFMPERYPART